MNLHDIILILHVLGAGVIIGLVFFSLTLVIKPPITPDKLKIYGYLGKFGPYASVWQLLTGLYLASAGWNDIKSLPIFWVKMGLYVIAGFIAAVLIKSKVKKAVVTNDLTPVQNLPLLTILFALVILAIVTIGVILLEHH